MRNVRCHDCGKRYNFDKDDFCPRCGAFTQPPHATRIGMNGQVVRVEGIDERNHSGSFAHAEFHDENRKRRGTELEHTTSVLKKAQMSSPLVKVKSSGKSISEWGDFLGDFIGEILGEKQ